MFISGSLLPFIAPKCIPNVTVRESWVCRQTVQLIVYPTCVPPQYEDCSLLD